MFIMLPRIIGVTTVVAAVALAVLLQVVSPSTAGPLGILGVFILIYLVALGLLSFFIYGLSRLVVVTAKQMVPRKPLGPLSFRQSYYYATVIATAPIITIGMMSVAQVGAYEVLLVMVLVGLGCFYVARRSS